MQYQMSHFPKRKIKRASSTRGRRRSKEQDEEGNMKMKQWILVAFTREKHQAGLETPSAFLFPIFFIWFSFTFWCVFGLSVQVIKNS